MKAEKVYVTPAPSTYDMRKPEVVRVEHLLTPWLEGFAASFSNSNIVFGGRIKL